jgi:lipopolysaccharide biosynthesis glycosyltransferase
VHKLSAPGLEIVVLDTGLADTTWDKVRCTVDTVRPGLKLRWRRERCEESALAARYRSAQARRPGSSSYARLLLPDLLPERERVLYLDADLLVDADITPLFALEWNGCLAAAVQDPYFARVDTQLPAEQVVPGTGHWPAFNAGVLLMNLKRWRVEQPVEALEARAGLVQGKFRDQAILNAALAGHWLPLATRWNRVLTLDPAHAWQRARPDSIWHFVARRKPWDFAVGEGRGLVADYYRLLRRIGWTPTVTGPSISLESSWLGAVRAAKAFLWRTARGRDRQMLAVKGGAR